MMLLLKAKARIVHMVPRNMRAIQARYLRRSGDSLCASDCVIEQVLVDMAIRFSLMELRANVVAQICTAATPFRLPTWTQRAESTSLR